MKIIVPVLALALCAACSPSNLSVRILGASPLDESCEGGGDVNLIRGFLNIGVATTGAYFAQFGTQSSMATSTTSADLGGEGGNDFIGERITLKYASSPATTFPTVDPTPIYFIIPAGTSDGFIRMNLLPSKIAQDLIGKVPPGNELTVFVSFSIEGHLFSGQGMRTNEVTFPIDVVNVPAPATCPSGAPPAAISGPCGNTGQDSLGFKCTG